MNKTEQKCVNKFLSRLQEIQYQMERLVDDIDEKVRHRSERYKDSDKGHLEREELHDLQCSLRAVETAIDNLVNLDLSLAQKQ